MRLSAHAWLAAVFGAVLLAGCNDQAAKAPAPLEPTAHSVSHFGGMLLSEHAGPKGQIFLKGRTTPVWFSSVGETVAFTMLPDEPAGVVAIYVNGMGKAKNWDRPEPDTWVEARRAWSLALSNMAIATSSGLGTPFDPTGRFNQIFDPSNGTCASRYLSVSVKTARATTADALSTAFSLMPQHSAWQVLEACGGGEALFFDWERRETTIGAT